MSREDTEAFAASLVQVLEAAPDFANGWFNLGKMRQQLGQTDEAIAAFRKVVELDPSDRLGASLQIARLGAYNTPESMPENYVRGMFDQYAPGFEADLVETLGYRAPALLRKAVEAACKAQGRMATFDSMLDLGCGTGLAGAAFRDCVKHLTGADLSHRHDCRCRTRKSMTGWKPRTSRGFSLPILPPDALVRWSWRPTSSCILGT